MTSTYLSLNAHVIFATRRRTQFFDAEVIGPWITWAVLHGALLRSLWRWAVSKITFTYWSDSPRQ